MLIVDGIPEQQKLSELPSLPEPIDLSETTPPPASKLFHDESFRDALRRTSKGSGSVMVTVGDGGYLPMLVNGLLTNVLRFGYDNVLVVATKPCVCNKLDKLMARHAALAGFSNGIGVTSPPGRGGRWSDTIEGNASSPLRRAYECWEYPQSEDIGSGTFGSVAFARVANTKTEIMMAAVHFGLDALIVDGDIVFLQDVAGSLALRDDRVPYLPANAREILPDVAMQDDRGSRNSGFMLARASRRSLAFLEESVRVAVESTDRTMHDQTAVNIVLQRAHGDVHGAGDSDVVVRGKELSLRVLDDRRYPCGKTYFEARAGGEMQRRAFAWVRACPGYAAAAPTYGDAWGSEALAPGAKREAEVGAGSLRDGCVGIFDCQRSVAGPTVGGSSGTRALGLLRGGWASGSAGAARPVARQTAAADSSSSNGSSVAEADSRCPLMIHNNWVNGNEAKIYRFKEMLLWFFDSMPPSPHSRGAVPTADGDGAIPQGMVQPRLAPPKPVQAILDGLSKIGAQPAGAFEGGVWPPGSDGGYYTGGSRRYLELVGGNQSASLKVQVAGLRAGFALAAASGRTLILPEFRCDGCRADAVGAPGCAPRSGKADAHPRRETIRARLTPTEGRTAGIARALAVAAAADVYQYSGSDSDADGCSFMAHWHVESLAVGAKGSFGGVEWRERMFRYAKLTSAAVRLPYREGHSGRGAMSRPPEPVTALVPGPTMGGPDPDAGGEPGGGEGSVGGRPWRRDEQEERARTGADGSLRVFVLPRAGPGERGKPGGGGTGGDGPGQGKVDMTAAAQLLMASRSSGGLGDEPVVRMSMSVLAEAGFGGGDPPQEEGAPPGPWFFDHFVPSYIRQNIAA